MYILPYILPYTPTIYTTIYTIITIHTLPYTLYTCINYHIHIHTTIQTTIYSTIYTIIPYHTIYTTIYTTIHHIHHHTTTTTLTIYPLLTPLTLPFPYIISINPPFSFFSLFPINPSFSFFPLLTLPYSLFSYVIHPHGPKDNIPHTRRHLLPRIVIATRREPNMRITNRVHLKVLAPESIGDLHFFLPAPRVLEGGGVHGADGGVVRDLLANVAPAVAAFGTKSRVR